MLRRMCFWIVVTVLVWGALTVLPTKVCFCQPPTSGSEKPLREPEGERKVKLGVKAVTRANGALILEVAKDSPADKAGIEPGDLIVSVDGFTIGIIDNLEYPLQSELRRVKGTGEFKIRNWRTGEVQTRKINLEAKGK